MLSEFDYNLPGESIAQEPAVERDGSRLMVVPRHQGQFGHLVFAEFSKLIEQGDLLVLNDTRVIPARLRGLKDTGGRAEILLDRSLGEAWVEDGWHCQRWSCLLHTSRSLKQGRRILLPAKGEAVLEGMVRPGKGFQVVLRLPGPLETYLSQHGEVPLPPYIRRQASNDRRAKMDQERYQTIFARVPGAVAAPTAGLHFTSRILEQIRSRGVPVVFLTLHVGPGTFLPLRGPELDQPELPPERYHIGDDVARAVARTRSAGHRVVAVGTTVVRALEAAWTGGQLKVGEGQTDLFIRPGYRFQVVDALLTNFHLPRSTLLMLVCAFSSTPRLLSAYRDAMDKGYRFYSYGDAMFLF